MATIIVETGSIVTNSNSYVSEADFNTYALDRGVTIANTITDAELLIKAMDYVESKSFIGNKKTQDQSLQWPRNYVVVDGFSVADDVIPQLLIDAVCEVAISIDSGTNPLANASRETIMEKVDVIEVQYSTSARAATYLTAAETKLNKLVNNMTNRAIRG